jgi:hypothetical protein
MQGDVRKKVIGKGRSGWGIEGIYRELKQMGSGRARLRTLYV